MAEALHFVHAEAKLIHLGVAPENVFVTPAGRWKLGGLFFAIPEAPGKESEVPFKFDGSALTLGGVGMESVILEPNLRYMAPEITLNERCSPASDLFSLACVVYQVMTQGQKALLENVRGNDKTGHRSCMSLLHPINFDRVPFQLRGALNLMLAISSHERPGLSVFTTCEYFNSNHVKAVRYLEALAEKEEAQRIQFLKGLTSVVEQFDRRVIKNRLLGPLLSALHMDGMAHFSLPAVIKILELPELIDEEYFKRSVWPFIGPLMSSPTVTIPSLTMLLEKLDYIMDRVPTPEQVTAHILPFVYKCIEVDSALIQENIVKKIPTLAARFDYKLLRSMVLPRLVNLILSTNVLSVRVHGLMCLSNTLSMFDKTTIAEQILTTMEKTSKVDRNPPVCMCLLGCFDALSKALGPDVTATRIIPSVSPILVEPALSSAQFQAHMSVIKKMIQRVEAARSAQLEAQAVPFGSDMKNPPPPPPGVVISGGSLTSTPKAAVPLGGHPPPPPPPPSAAGPGSSADPLGFLAALNGSTSNQIPGSRSASNSVGSGSAGAMPSFADMMGGSVGNAPPPPPPPSAGGSDFFASFPDLSKDLANNSNNNKSGSNSLWDFDLSGSTAPVVSDNLASFVAKSSSPVPSSSQTMTPSSTQGNSMFSNLNMKSTASTVNDDPFAAFATTTSKQPEIRPIAPSSRGSTTSNLAGASISSSAKSVPRLTPPSASSNPVMKTSTVSATAPKANNIDALFSGMSILPGASQNVAPTMQPTANHNPFGAAAPGTMQSSAPYPSYSQPLQPIPGSNFTMQPQPTGVGMTNSMASGMGGPMGPGLGAPAYPSGGMQNMQMPMSGYGGPSVSTNPYGNMNMNMNMGGIAPPQTYGQPYQPQAPQAVPGTFGPPMTSGPVNLPPTNQTPQNFDPSDPFAGLG
eukprot:GILK01003870.1.p1 GENE.GILK01003870.1~~GILK01003870.1.p1  ORF type:complete len:1068 (+),score=163.83 GILK01003870.1:454-3204(+)